MAKKFTVGLVYTFDENWIAGPYYIQNLICALKTLPENERPFLKIYCYKESEYVGLIAKTNYYPSSPVYIKNVTSIIDRVINKLSVNLFGKHWITGVKDTDVDILFPSPLSYHFTNVKNKLIWIPDFQEKHYPGFFLAEQIDARKKMYEEIVRGEFPIVLSSLHARNDFRQLYPDAVNKLFVLPFAVTLPDFSGLDIQTLKEKYRLPDRYFICSNQFWAHKNHQVVLKALKDLRDQGIHAMVAFTGKPYDNRNPDYYESLMSQVTDHSLNDYVRFLGLIPRDEQLALLNHSLAIIQPSLFEGWSTVVEDGKALNKHILASDLAVHREQLPDYPLFFQPYDFEALSKMMHNLLEKHQKHIVIDYAKSVESFGRSFVNLVRTLVP